MMITYGLAERRWDWLGIACLLAILFVLGCVTEVEPDVAHPSWGAPCALAVDGTDNTCKEGSFCRCGICARGCSGFGECGKGFACVQSTGQGQCTACAADSSASECIEELLPQNICLPDECAEDGDCSSGFKCVDSLCTVAGG